MARLTIRINDGTADCLNRMALNNRTSAGRAAGEILEAVLGTPPEVLDYLIHTCAGMISEKRQDSPGRKAQRRCVALMDLFSEIRDLEEV